MIEPKQCTAVVLAGGRSRRMRRDKAGLPHPDGGTLLNHQLALLGSVGFAERLVSVRADQVRPEVPSTIRRVHDDGTAGPLGGIVASLRASATPWLLVLAVDLPHAHRTLIQQLLAHGVTRGVVPATAHGLEPLAAIYPAGWLPVAENAMAEQRFGLQALLDSPASTPWFERVPWTDDATFTNWNHPEDLPPH